MARGRSNQRDKPGEMKRSHYPQIVADRIVASQTLNRMLAFMDGVYDPEAKLVVSREDPTVSVHLTNKQVDLGIALLKKVCPDKREMALTSEEGPLQVVLHVDGNGLQGKSEGHAENPYPE